MFQFIKKNPSRKEKMNPILLCQEKRKPSANQSLTRQNKNKIKFHKTCKKRLKKQERADGIFPLLSTDSSIGPKEALLSYKYQPRLEKRFNQFKSVHEAAPILFKNIKRVEAIMFLFFVALIVQGIIERKVRMSMKERAIKSLPVYPEYRKSFYPTT